MRMAVRPVQHTTDNDMAPYYKQQSSLLGMDISFCGFKNGSTNEIFKQKRHHRDMQFKIDMKEKGEGGNQTVMHPKTAYQLGSLLFAFMNCRPFATPCACIAWVDMMSSSPHHTFACS